MLLVRLARREEATQERGTQEVSPDRAQGALGECLGYELPGEGLEMWRRMRRLFCYLSSRLVKGEAVGESKRRSTGTREEKIQVSPYADHIEDREVVRRRLEDDLERLAGQIREEGLDRRPRDLFGDSEEETCWGDARGRGKQGG